MINPSSKLSTLTWVCPRVCQGSWTKWSQSSNDNTIIQSITTSESPSPPHGLHATSPSISHPLFLKPHSRYLSKSRQNIPPSNLGESHLSLSLPSLEPHSLHQNTPSSTVLGRNYWHSPSNIQETHNKPRSPRIHDGRMTYHKNTPNYSVHLNTSPYISPYMTLVSLLKPFCKYVHQSISNITWLDLGVIRKRKARACVASEEGAHGPKYLERNEVSPARFDHDQDQGSKLG